MAAVEAQCPRCGATVRFLWAGAIAAVCAFCRSTVVRRDLDVERIGELAPPAEDYSPLQLEVRGKWKGSSFAVVGRLQLEIPDRAHWNEWFVAFSDGRAGWLADPQGQCFITFGVPLKGDAPPYADLQPGKRYELNGRAYTVLEVGEARCTGGEGQLPFAVGEGYVYRFADLRTPSRAFATLDYPRAAEGAPVSVSGGGSDPARPQLYTGEAVELRELSCDGLRDFEGWERT
jgi:hypothetical protein